VSKSIVLGAGGQDGSYLCELLLEKQHEVIAVVRRASTNNLQWLENLDIQIIYGDIMDTIFINRLIKNYRPDYCFCCAAMSHVGISFEIPQYTINVNTIGVLNVLEAIRQHSPQTRFLQCSTSEMLAKPEIHETGTLGSSNEETAFEVHSPYAVSKLAAHWLVKIYREAYGLFACCSICYNHESSRRSDNFVTQKIVKNLVAMKYGKIKSFELGNIEAYRDWGYSPDFCEAMVLMLQHDTPDDYVIATNESHSVKEFIEECCRQLGLKAEFYGTYSHFQILKNNELIGTIPVNRTEKRPWDVDYLRGDYSKAERVLGWKPKVRFKELIKIMIEAELKK